MIVYLKVEGNNRIKNTETESPTIQNIINKRLISGILIPTKEITLKPQLSGILEEIYVKVGDKVKKGDGIARIRIMADPNNLEIAARNKKTAQIRYENEQKIFQRNQTLFQKNILPQSEMESAEQSFHLSKEEYESTKTQYEIIKNGYSKNQHEVSDIVAATSSGTILELPLREGASVIERNTYNEGSTIAVIADLEDLNFRGLINESDIIHLKEGIPFKLNIPALNGYSTTAKLERISPKGVEQNGIMKFEIEAKVTFPDKSQIIRSGYSAIAEIILQKSDSTITINERNLIWEKDSAYIELFKPDFTTQKHLVKTGLSNGLRIEITEGISLTDKVIVQKN